MGAGRPAADRSGLALEDPSDEGCGMTVTGRLARWLLICFAGCALIVGAPVLATAQGAPGVPVTVTTATKQDVPLWLRGLGTVQAYYAVQLRPRVDGTLAQGPGAEGENVKKGDLLAVID